MSATAASEPRPVELGTDAVATAPWNRLLAAFVLLVWLVPIKLYTLPVQLPFKLEPYRLTLIALVVGWLVAVARGHKRIGAGGRGRALAALAVVAVLSVVVNLRAIDNGGLQTQAIKSLSYFLSFLLAYVLVFSVVEGTRGVETIVQAFVVGGTIVALCALYESRTHYNVFTHLEKWVPFLHPTHVVGSTHVRGGQLRVIASAQHPIALGVALMLVVPFALYLAGHARTRARSLLAWGSALLCAAAAAATISRTVVLMALAMIAAAVYLRRKEIVRRWPLLVALVLALHVAAPGSTSHIYRAFFPKQGLSTSLDARSGAVGSGRLADLAPAVRSWQQVPFFGHGLGTGAGTSSGGVGAIVDPKTGAPIVFDDQYLNSFVSIGLLGLLAVVWFVWGSGLALLRRARTGLTPTDDLRAACAVAAIGFAAAMVTFDAFFFVQCTLLFFVVVALGMKLQEEPA